MTTQYKKIWIKFTSGNGPAECALAVNKAVAKFLDEARSACLLAELIDTVPGRNKGTLASALICVSGEQTVKILKRWIGSIKWTCESPYRAHHKRKNWFIGVNIVEVTQTEIAQLHAEDIIWKTSRSSGPGGQHVNTTDSAIQATHKPSGIQVTASEERSQHMNKKIAYEKIATALSARAEEERAAQRQDQWSLNKSLERGNPIRAFQGACFLEK